MKPISLDYLLLEKDKDEAGKKRPGIKIVNGVPVLDGSLFDNKFKEITASVYSIGDGDLKDDGGYPVQKTEYQALIEEGHTSIRVTDKELDPFVKGWFKPKSLKRVHTDWESDWHEYFHCKGYGEYDTRTIMRNLLNFYGKRGDYHF